MRTSDRRSTRMMAVGVLTVAGLGLAACGPQGPAPDDPLADGEVEEPVQEPLDDPPAEEPTTTEPTAAGPTGEGPTGEGPTAGTVYVGPYDQAFIDDLGTYTAQEVTVTGDVDETLTPDAFTIGADVDPLLVIETQESIPPVDPGQEVEVTGTVEEIFEIVAVEEEFGIDLDDELFVAYESQPYLVASTGRIVDPG